jgi:hypothetical protein
MGFLDVLRGKRKLAQPAPDRLFAFSTAYVTMEMTLELKSSGKAAIVFQPLATADFDQIVRDMEEVVHGTGSDTGTTVRRTDDEYGYRWMVLADEDFDDLVVGINAVSGALQDGGSGERILCAVFSFRDAQQRPVYWIYNYKRGAFYPFVPAGGAQQRDNERELRLKAQIGAELPVEAELDEAEVGRRDDHVGLLDLVVAEPLAVAAHQLEHRLEELVEAVLVARLDRGDGLVVEVVEPGRILVGQPVLILGRDPDDHAGRSCSEGSPLAPEPSSPAAGALPEPSSAFIRARSSSTALPEVSSES